MQDFRETIIRIDHGSKSAEGWTEQAGLASRLKKLGFKEIKQQGKGVWLLGGRRQISFRKARSSNGSGARKGIPEGLRKAIEARKAKVGGTA